MRQWSPWSARAFLAVLVVLPTSLGTSTSAAVVGGDVDELASVRATVGKVWVEVVAAAAWLVGSARSSVPPNIAPSSTRTRRIPPKNAKGWRRRKDRTPPPGSWLRWRLSLTGLLWSPAVGIYPPIRHEPPSPLK